MRVAVDCHMVASPKPGDAGNGRYAAALTRALARTARAEDEVAALVTRPGALTHIGPGIRGVRVPEGNARRLVAGAAHAVRHIEADASVFTYIAPRKLPSRLALAIHDPTFVTNPEWLGRRARLILSQLVPTSARRADVVLALSTTAKTDICAALGLPEERVAVVSPAPAELFRADDGARARVRDLHELGRYVLSVGDIGPRKNLGALVDAVERIGEPGLELVLVGRAAREAEQVISDPRVRWLGPVADEELADLYRAASVVAHPARYEGFGLTVLEALACGSPVVVSNTGALPEVVGDAGIVVHPDVEGLAEGIRAALEPVEADRLREAGPDRAGAFTVTKMGDAAWNALERGGDR